MSTPGRSAAGSHPAGKPGKRPRPFHLAAPHGPFYDGRPMKFFSELRDLREMERAGASADPAEARKRLEEIYPRHPEDPRAAGLVALGDVEGALEAAAAAARGGMALASAGVLRAEVLLDAGRTPEARAVLEEARAVDPAGVAAPGLLAVLDLEERAGRGAVETIAGLPPGALWCTPVLSRLVLGLERAIDARVRAGDSPPGLHAARTVLFRPSLEKGGFRRFWVERLADLLDPLRSPAARAARARDRDLQAALGAGDLTRAEELLAAYPLGEREKDGGRGLLLSLEIAFLRDRLDEVERIRKAWLKAGGDAADPYPAALEAYARLARGRPDEALEGLTGARSAGEVPAALLHLAAVAEVARGKGPAAAGLLRKAVRLDDIGMVRVAREEAACLASAPAAGAAKG